MFELTENTGSLDQVTQYELILSHCLEKLGVNGKRWHHSDAFTAAIDYARKSGYLNAKNELTVLGKSLVALQSFELSEAAQDRAMKKCDCGRSPTQYCVGWHHLSHELWQTKKLIAEAKLRAELLEKEYRNLIFPDDWPQFLSACYQATGTGQG